MFLFVYDLFSFFYFKWFYIAFNIIYLFLYCNNLNSIITVFIGLLFELYVTFYGLS